MVRWSRVSSLHAVPYCTVVALVVAAMGRKSLLYLSGSTSWASSTSRRMLAVAPTTLLWGAALRKVQVALPMPI